MCVVVFIDNLRTRYHECANLVRYGSQQRGRNVPHLKFPCRNLYVGIPRGPRAPSPGTSLDGARGHSYCCDLVRCN